MAIALRYLEPSEMLQLSASWLGPARATVESIAELAPLLPRLTEVHRGLDEAVKQGGTPGERLEKLSQQARDVDDQHDHAVRALYYTILASMEHLLSQAEPDIDAVTRLEVLRDMVLPEGLATTQQSYEVEAAVAVRAAEAVASDREAQRVLQKLHLGPKVTGVDLLSAWHDLGQKLGTIELQRAAASRDQEQGAPTPTPARARNSWLSLVATMLSVLEQSHSSPAARKAFLTPIEAACAVAAKRYAEGRKKV